MILSLLYLSIVIAIIIEFPTHVGGLRRLFHKTRLFTVSYASQAERMALEPMQQLLFVETGFGCDQHGQNATKAAVRACRNAIEFNSVPSIRNVVPGGRDNMILRIKIGVPSPETVDHDAIRAVFPYGRFMPLEITDGGLLASSGIAMPELGDKNDNMYIAIAVVYLGY